jgi:adenosylhomocysteine/aminodeoxyfutalosine nucleosidase
MSKIIGIIGAMEVEVEEFKNRFEILSTIKYGGFKIYKAKKGDIDIVFCYSKVGKVFSTMAATTLITKFNITHLIFTGIAGALNEQYKVLDVCLADKTCQHDIDITAFGHPKGFLSESGGVYIDCQNELFELAKTIVLENGLDINIGTIATGDQFVSSPEKKKEIKEVFGADMIEMEGGSVAVVAKQFDIPFLITRTISDSATGDGLMEFNEFIQKAASKNAKFVDLLIENI